MCSIPFFHGFTELYFSSDKVIAPLSDQVWAGLTRLAIIRRSAMMVSFQRVHDLHMNYMDSDACEQKYIAFHGRPPTSRIQGAKEVNSSVCEGW